MRANRVLHATLFGFGGGSAINLLGTGEFVGAFVLGMLTWVFCGMYRIWLDRIG